MSIRLMITIMATPGKVDELKKSLQNRCAEVVQEPGCEQFEAFQSVVDPDRFIMLERWKDQEALDEHAKIPPRSPSAPGLQVDRGQREDYEYNRTR